MIYSANVFGTIKIAKGIYWPPANPGHIRNPWLFRAIIPMEESIEIRYQNHFDFNLVNNRNAAKSSSGRAERDSKRQRDDRVKFRGDWVPALGTTNATQGIVVVQVRLEKDGNVADALALSGSELLTAPSVANARKWRFQPTTKRTAIIVYNFRMPSVVCNSKTAASFSVLQPPNFVTITGCEVAVQP